MRSFQSASYRNLQQIVDYLEFIQNYICSPLKIGDILIKIHSILQYLIMGSRLASKLIQQDQVGSIL